MKFNWGHKVALSFVLFAAFILYMVVRAFQEDIDLVAEDYYAQEIGFQAKMQQQANLSDLGERVSLIVLKEDITFTFPTVSEFGEIHFYHTSHSDFDKKMPLSLDSKNQQIVSREGLVLGSYRVKVTWSDAGKEYFQQENIFLQ